MSLLMFSLGVGATKNAKFCADGRPVLVKVVQCIIGFRPQGGVSEPRWPYYCSTQTLKTLGRREPVSDEQQSSQHTHMLPVSATFIKKRWMSLRCAESRVMTALRLNGAS